MFRHALDSNRAPEEPLIKSWTPFPMDYRLLSALETLNDTVAIIIASSYFVYLAVVILRLVGELEVLKSILSDPHYMKENTNYSISDILKCCVKHHQIINKSVILFIANLKKQTFIP